MKKIDYIYSKKKFFLILFIIFISYFNLFTLIAQDNNINEQIRNVDEINKNLSGENQKAVEKSNNSITSFFLRTVLVLLILAVIYLFVRYRFNRNIDTKNSKKYFSILLKQQISRNISLAILEFFGSYYIISLGNDITILEKIENQELIDSIKLEASKEQPKKTFLDYLGFNQEKVDSTTVISKFNELKDKINNFNKKGKTE